ncbi:MAG: zinc ribbon domain-containing protein [Myxococcota bacterium]
MNARRGARRPPRTRAVGAAIASLFAFGLALTGPAPSARSQHAGDPSTAPPPPAGDARIVVEVVAAGASDVGGLDVALYSLGSDGRPGFTSAQTDAEGRVVFANVSNAPDLVYLIGTRYHDVPFGQRLTFEPGRTEATASLEVSAPTTRTAGVRVEELRIRADWLGDRVLVREILRLVNPGAKVIQLPASEGERSGPAIVNRPLPPGASGFEAGTLSLSDGLASEGGVVRYRGPLYPREQTIEYQYTLPLAEGERRLALPVELDRAAARVVAIAGTAGMTIEGAGLVRSSEVSAESGQPLSAWARGALDAGERTKLELLLPEARADADLVAIPRADVWIDLDDTRLNATVDLQLAVTPGAPVAGTPDTPLIAITLPDGASLTGVSPESERLGLIPREHGFDVVGPLGSGETQLGYAYRLDAGPSGAELALRFPRAVSTLNVLIADTGLALESSRLHRLRAFRSGTRNYLHREAFNVADDETVDLRIEPLRARGMPREAGALVAIVSVIGAAAFVVAPLTRRRRSAMPAEASTADAAREQLRTEREATYEAILDLDHDFETGKLEPEDHRAQRDALRARAIALLAAERAEADADTPSEVASASEPTTTPQPLPADGAARLAPPLPRAAGYCPQCGAAREAGWRFCAGCGASLPTLREPGA